MNNDPPLGLSVRLHATTNTIVQPLRGSLVRSLYRASRAANQMWIQLLQNFRSPRTAWWDLNDHLLSDIGKTRAGAEFEVLRRSWSGRTVVGPEARVPGPICSGASVVDVPRPW